MLFIYKRLERSLFNLRSFTDENDPDGADAILDELEDIWWKLSEGDRQKLMLERSSTWPRKG